jgi:hypothetical protein
MAAAPNAQERGEPMKHRLLLAIACFAIAFGACRGDRPPPRVDGGVDMRSIDAIDAKNPADPAPDGQQIPDTGVDTGADQAAPRDSLPADVVATDVLAPDISPDSSPDAGSPDVTRDATAPLDAGATCGPVLRADVCVSYCDGIGRFCGGANTQFRNADECRAACNAPTWPCGQPGAVAGNSLFCRMSHVVLAGIGAAATECPNAGPSSPACQ